MGRKIVEKGDRLLFLKLKKRLKGKVVIVGVGNPLKGDDGAGLFFIQQLKNVVARPTSAAGAPALQKRGQSPKKRTVPFLLIDAGEVPENYLSPIIKAKPDTIMVVDAADFGGKPGEVRIFETEDISKIGFTTHTLSPRVFMDCLKQQTDADIFLLAIQPQTIELGAFLTPELKSSIKKLVKAFLV